MNLTLKDIVEGEWDVGFSMNLGKWREGHKWVCEMIGVPYDLQDRLYYPEYSDSEKILFISGRTKDGERYIAARVFEEDFDNYLAQRKKEFNKKIKGQSP